MKKFSRITFLSIGMLTVIAYLIFAVCSIYIYLTESDDFVPMSFLVTLISHAVLALIVTIAGIVRTVKNRKMVLISGFFMQLWLLWMAFGVCILWVSLLVRWCF